jgi:hypothetical protein
MRIIFLLISSVYLSGCCLLPSFSNDTATISMESSASKITIEKNYRGMAHGPISCLFTGEYESTLFIHTDKVSGKIYPGEFSLGEKGDKSSKALKGHIELDDDQLVINLQSFYSDTGKFKHNFFNGEYKVIKVAP